MATMTQTTGNTPDIAASAEAPASTSQCGRGYYMMSFMIPFTTVTIMYILGNSPICDVKVIPGSAICGLLAGTCGFVLYKGCKLLKHAIHPH